MLDTETITEILRLFVEERLALADAISASVADAPEAVPVPEWHREILLGRLHADDNDDAPGESWFDLRRRIERTG